MLVHFEHKFHYCLLSLTKTTGFLKINVNDVYD